MSSLIDLPRALLRGRYAVVAAAMEHCGVPLDVDMLDQLVAQGPGLRARLIQEVDEAYGVFEDGSFRESRFRHYLACQGLAWPTLKNGRLALDKDIFREMARAFPQLRDLHQLRETLAHFRELKLTVGEDGRNRYPIFPFSARTGRNQPSTNRNVFGLPSWMRGLIQPVPGMALAYIDFAQQELAIAAALSGDMAMLEAYKSGDFYMAFAIRVGAVPPNATKATHPNERERFKQCALGVLFGMEDRGLARRLGISIPEARRLLQAHRQTFATFWRWSDATIDQAMLNGRLQTVFGWTLHVTRQTKVRTLRNFPMQANGAEMLRIAGIGLFEAGIHVCAPVHDAVLIEASLADIEAAVITTQTIMREASIAVLDGVGVYSDARIIRPPSRFVEAKGTKMWNRVMNLLGRADAMVELGKG